MRILTDEHGSSTGSPHIRLQESSQTASSTYTTNARGPGVAGSTAGQHVRVRVEFIRWPLAAAAQRGGPRGESDTRDLEDAESYGARLTSLIQNIRQDFAAPRLPFMVGELGR